MNKYKGGTFYWVRVDGYDNKYLPIYHNDSSQWRVDIYDRTVFISTYKLQLLFGKNCIQREVDLVNDVSEEGHLPPSPKAVLVPTERQGLHILMANHVGTIVSGMQTTWLHKGYKVLEFKEDKE